MLGPIYPVPVLRFTLPPFVYSFSHRFAILGRFACITLTFVTRFFGETLSLRSKVNNRNAKTIFGPIKITDNKIKKTKEIEIIFRSEAFNITKNNAKKNPRKIKSKIIAVKYIRENSYLHIDILNNSVQKHLHIKVPGKFIPPKNKICYININKKNFFIF